MSDSIIERELTQGVVPIGTPKAYQYDQALVESAVATVIQGLTQIGTYTEEKKSEYLAQANTILTAIQNQYGYPFVASAVADMTDTSKIYVYTGVEEGYTAGNWYYNNGSAWVSGGVFNSTSASTLAEMSLFGVDDLLWDNTDPTGNSSGNVTKTVDKINKTVTLTGTANAITALNFWKNSMGFPAWLQKEKDYYVHMYNSTNVCFEVIEYIGSDYTTIAQITNGYSKFRLSSSATGVLIRLYIPSGTVTNCVVRPFVSETLSLVDVETNVNNLKNNNYFDIIDKNRLTNSATYGYSWNADKTECEITGTSTSDRYNTLYHLITDIYSLKIGKTYTIDYTSTDENLNIIVYGYNNGQYAGTILNGKGYFTWDNEYEDVYIYIIYKANAVPNNSKISNIHIVENPVFDVFQSLYDNRNPNSNMLCVPTLWRNSIDGYNTEHPYTTADMPVNSYAHILGSSFSDPNIALLSGSAYYMSCVPLSSNLAIRMYEIIRLDIDNPTHYIGKSYDYGATVTWHNLQYGTEVNNSYTTNHYENTYNVTATPTITTDTNNILASTNDTTDRTADIQAMLSTTGYCKLGVGTFYVSGVDIPNFATLDGCGNATEIILASSVTDGYAVKLNSYSTVKNIMIQGSTSNITMTGTVGTRHGILFEGNANSDNDDIPQRSTISEVTVRRFSGGGITCTNTGYPTAGMNVSNVVIRNCEAGVNIAYWSEFHRFTNVNATENYYGCINNGGNNYFANCNFSSNTCGILMDNQYEQSPNNSHGTFSCCAFHHSDNNTGYGIKIYGMKAGEIFQGCQIGYSQTLIDACTGVRFVGCNFLRSSQITISNSSAVIYDACQFRVAEDTPVTVTNSTGVHFNNCYLRDGTAFDPLA